MTFPEAMDKANFFSSPKKHTRKPDSHWDFVTKGADIQSAWVENIDGVKEREIDGKLENYSMRSKGVDPSALGVDPDVKQISGYLDDDENDKHLFYCRITLLFIPCNMTDYTKGSSSRGTTLRMIPSSFGLMEDQAVVP